MRWNVEIFGVMQLFLECIELELFKYTAMAEKKTIFQSKYFSLNHNDFCLFRFSAIKSTIDLLASEGLTIRGYVVDISNREEVFETAKVVKDQIGCVDILINNAGIVCCKPLWELSEKVIEKTYAVNILSHYWVCDLI